jgi:hypothetical protein
MKWWEEGSEITQFLVTTANEVSSIIKMHEHKLYISHEQT